MNLLLKKDFRWREWLQKSEGKTEGFCTAISPLTLAEQ